MKKNMKKICWAAAFVLLVVCGMVGYWGMKYYGVPGVMVEVPDRSLYNSLEERAVVAKRVAARNGLSQNYCLFVDYSIPSGTPRLFVWSFAENRVVARTYVMHGPGKGSTAEKPVFSNQAGSNCSALGRFVVTRHHGNRNKTGHRLAGLDLDNKNAFARGLMIHRSSWVDMNCWRTYIPLRARNCKGCVTVSSRGMDYIGKLARKEDKRMLLWSFYEES